MNDYIAELYAKYDFLRGELNWLVGYYNDRGAVPVEVLNKVLAGEKVSSLPEVTIR